MAKQKEKRIKNVVEGLSILGFDKLEKDLQSLWLQVISDAIQISDFHFTKVKDLRFIKYKKSSKDLIYAIITRARGGIRLRFKYSKIVKIPPFQDLLVPYRNDKSIIINNKSDWEEHKAKLIWWYNNFDY